MCYTDSVTVLRKHDQSRAIVDITGSILTYGRKHDRTLAVITGCYTDSKTAQSNSSEHYRVLYHDRQDESKSELLILNSISLLDTE